MDRMTRILCCLTIWSCAVIDASAALVDFTYQGELKQAEAPLTGTVDLQFRLYASMEGGDPVGGQAQQPGVSVVDGVFTASLSFDDSVFDGTLYYLEIDVKLSGNGSYTTLSPRQPITPAPYAINALNAKDGDITGVLPGTGIVGGGEIGDVTISADSSYLQRRVSSGCPAGSAIRSIASDGAVTCETDDIGDGGTIWSQSGANAYYNLGNVGIGTANPVERLAVAGNIRMNPNSSLISENGSLGFLNSLGNGSGGAQLNNVGSIDLVIDKDDNDSNRSLRVLANGADRSTATTLVSVLENGNVGFGTASPGNRLHIPGGSDVSASGGGMIQLGEDTGTNIGFDDNEIQARNSGVAGALNLNAEGGDVYMVNNAQGRVGIGTSTPQNPLDVRGIGTAVGGDFGGSDLPEVVARFRQTADNTRHSAISIDSEPGQDPIVFFANNGVALWDIRVDADDFGVLEIRQQDGDRNDTVVRIEPGNQNSPIRFFRDFEVRGIESNTVSPTIDDTWTLGRDTRRWKEVFAKNGTINTSDRRAKHSIETVEDALGTVLKLRPVSYQWIDNPEDQRHYGLIAQEVQEVMPEVVHVPEDPEAMLGLKYTELVPVLIRSIQQQQAQIEALEKRLAELESD